MNRYDRSIWLTAAVILAVNTEVRGQQETGSVRPGAGATYRVTLQAGVTTTVKVKGSPASRLNVYLFDTNSVDREQLAADESSSNECKV